MTHGSRPGDLLAVPGSGAHNHAVASPDDALADRAEYEHGKVDEAADDHDHSQQEHRERRPGGVERGPGAGVNARAGE